MGPELSTNIASMIIAMQRDILPVIGPEHKVAQEKAYLILVYLGILRDQHDKLLHFRLKEIREFDVLLTALLEKAGASRAIDGEVEAIARQVSNEAVALRTLRLPSYEALAGVAVRLREAVDALTQSLLENEPQNSSLAKEIAGLLLRQSESEIARERSWVAALGLDPDPRSLQPLSELLDCNDEAIGGKGHKGEF